MAGGIDRIILREKDLSQDEYRRLAEQVLAVCRPYRTECLLHSFADVSRQLAHPKIHLPLPAVQSIERDSFWQMVGVSVHSREEAREAEGWGADYLTAGHIFETDCKRGLAGRGTEFLAEVCAAVRVPVWAIGGITEQNVSVLGGTGIAGICLMSSAMQAEDPNRFLSLLRERMA